MSIIAERSGAFLPEGLTALIRPDTFPRSVYQPCKETGQMIPDKFATDLRALGPTHVCVCGCNVFKSLMAFEDYEIAWWYLEGECLNCGNTVTLPCPVDRPE